MNVEAFSTTTGRGNSLYMERCWSMLPRTSELSKNCTNATRIRTSISHLATFASSEENLLQVLLLP